MQAGRLCHKVTIQNFTVTRLPSGQQQNVWVDGMTVWAEVKGVSSRELMTSGAHKSEATVRVCIRFRTDVTAASRIKCITGPFKGKVLDVTGDPIPTAKATELEMLCKQGVNT
ncbi:phage head closure protein [Pantoea sp. GD03673]|uniref:phage head closure protein n=1 Tax=Pantoea sp. GD03673 TaxID=2975364 RepID=UPI00244A435C|nr:phage head closure protein [Pantoea sp. GD03673]MDH2066884.1 phage head closure protein [Pantoea sp. GD03673]